MCARARAHFYTACSVMHAARDARRTLEAREMDEVSPETEYRRGEWIEYSSDSRGAWLPAQVARVHRDGTLTLDVTTSRGTIIKSPVPDHLVRRRDRGSESPAKPRRDAALERATTASGTQYQVGQTIEYSSVTLEAWVPATVEAISPRAGARLRLTNGRIISDVPTHVMRHRTASEILRELREERARKKRAQRAAEQEAITLAQHEADILALEKKIAGNWCRMAELELVVFSGPTSKYGALFGCALRNLAGSTRPGEDWRPAFTKQGVEQDLDLQVQQGLNGGAEKAVHDRKGVRFWNLTDGELVCDVMDAERQVSLNMPIRAPPFDLSSSPDPRYCKWTCAQLTDTSTLYRVSISGSGLPPRDYWVNGDSSQHVVVRVAESPSPLAPEHFCKAPGVDPVPGDGQCLFNAIDQTKLHDRTPHPLRLEVVEWVRNNWTANPDISAMMPHLAELLGGALPLHDVFPEIRSSSDLEGYLDRMSHYSEYGEDREAAIAAHIRGYSVTIYRRDSDVTELEVLVPVGRDGGEARSIVLSNRDSGFGAHYDIYRPPDTAARTSTGRSDGSSLGRTWSGAKDPHWKWVGISAAGTPVAVEMVPDITEIETDAHGTRRGKYYYSRSRERFWHVEWVEPRIRPHRLDVPDDRPGR